MKTLFVFLLSFSLLAISCEDNTSEEPGNSWFKPAPGATFDWDLRSDIPAGFSYTAEIVDIDAFDNDKSFVAHLHVQGKKVFAYVSVGSWENWRPDKDDFPTELIGNDYPGWEGEKFLNIKNIESLKPIMRARFDMIKAKGFDGIEPDNIDLNSWTTETLGFPISDQDVIAYCKWLVQEAHSRGLCIGQKNATDLSEDLVDIMDWALLEDAFYDDFYLEAQPYITHDKAVFATEYTDNTEIHTFQEVICPRAASLHYTVILKNRALDGFITSCD